MVRLAAAMALLAVGVAAFAPASAKALAESGPQSGVEATVRVAEAQLANGDRTGALQTAEGVLAADPLNVPAHHIIQRILRRGDQAAMLARYAALARRYPGSPAAQYLYGNALLNSQDATGARSYFNRALQLDPGFGWAATLEAAFAQARGDTREALRLLVPVDPLEIGADLLTTAMYADLLRLNGLRAEAISFLEQAAAINPDEPRFLLELWKMRMRGVDDWQGERASFAWQVAANRERFLTSPELAAELARFYQGSAMGDPDGSRALWLALADRFPGNAEAKNALLRAAGMTNTFDERMAIYDRILADYPDSAIRYQVYYDMLHELIETEQYEHAERLARGLTTEIDPGRTGDAGGPFEKPTPWGFTLPGIGFAGWFAAAQAKDGAGERAVYNTWGVGGNEQPISPAALTAARTMEASDCQDPRALQYVAQYLLESSFHRLLGIRLMERAARAAAGADPLTELAYGTDHLESTRADLERYLRRMPIYYALAGMTVEAEHALDRLLTELPPSGSNAGSAARTQTYQIAGKVYGLIGRWREAAHFYLLAMWESPYLPSTMTDGLLADLTRIYAEIDSGAIQRFAPGTGPRLPVMRAGLAPVNGAASLDAEALGGDLLLMVFWASWNDASSAQVLALDALALELQDPRLSALAVAVQEASPPSRSDGLDRFGRYRRDNALTLPVARAEVQAIDRLDLTGLPTTMLLDATGRVLARQLGYNVDRAAWSQQWRAVVHQELARLAAEGR